MEKEMEAKINIKIKFKNKELNFDYDDGEKLFNELKKIYEKQEVTRWYPQYEPCRIYPYTWTTTDNETTLDITCNNSNMGENNGK